MPRKNQQQSMAQEALGRSGPALLIVTASSVEAELFQEIGRPWEYELTACQDYWQAGWELIRRHYDLVLIDIDLDPALGLEWLSRLLSLAPNLSIIALTGDSSREREIAARNRGIAFYFVRPVEQMPLAAILEHVAHKRTRDRQGISQTGCERTAPGDSLSDCGWKAWKAGLDRRKATDRRKRSST